MAAEYLLDVDLDWFVWPPAAAAWPQCRGRWPRQLRTSWSPEELAARLQALGYVGGSAHVFAGHEETLSMWASLPRPAGAERVAVHVDAHGDLKGARGGWIHLDPQTGRELVGPANFLRVAAWAGLVRRVIWVVPDRMWRSAKRLAGEIDAFSDEPARAGEGSLMARMPGSIEIELLPLRALPPADGPVLARGLALSPEWIDARLYPALARRATTALVRDDPSGPRSVRRTLRWRHAPARSPVPPRDRG